MLRPWSPHRVSSSLTHLFDVGNEVLAFHDFGQLIDQATRLLNEKRSHTTTGRRSVHMRPQL
jgi:hypothetical protein